MNRRDFVRKTVLALGAVAAAPHIQYSPITPASYDGERLTLYLEDEIAFIGRPTRSIYEFLMSHPMRRRDIFTTTTVEDLS